MKSSSFVFLAGGLATALVVFTICPRWMRAHSFPVFPLSDAELPQYIFRDAAFALTVECSFPRHAPHEVFAALLDERFMSWMPLTDGVRYLDKKTGHVGTRRALRHRFFVLSEQIVLCDLDMRLGVTVEGMSLPLLRSAGTLYEVEADGSGGSRLIWRVGGTPKWVGHERLRKLAPLLRPAARSQLAKLEVLLPQRGSEPGACPTANG